MATSRAAGTSSPRMFATGGRPLPARHTVHGALVAVTSCASAATAEVPGRSGPWMTILGAGRSPPVVLRYAASSGALPGFEFGMGVERTRPPSPGRDLRLYLGSTCAS